MGLGVSYLRGAGSHLECRMFPPVFERALDQRRGSSQYLSVSRLLLRGCVGLWRQDTWNRFGVAESGSKGVVTLIFDPKWHFPPYSELSSAQNHPKWLSTRLQPKCSHPCLP